MTPLLPTRRRSPGARMKQMRQQKKVIQASSKTLPKVFTGIQGLDEITGGGLPRGRPTLISGGAGSGKTLFGMEFLVRGATQYNEPGVFMSFEETIPDLTKNVASLGFDLDRLVHPVDPARHRGVRLRLRDPAGPSYPGGDLDPAPAHRQVPGIDPRHERVSVPHR